MLHEFDKFIEILQKTDLYECWAILTTKSDIEILQVYIEKNYSRIFGEDALDLNLDCRQFAVYLTHKQGKFLPFYKVKDRIE